MSTTNTEGFSSQEEVDAYLEKVYKMQPTIWAINQAFPKQGRAGSVYWVCGRWLVPRTEKTIVLGGKKDVR